QLERAAHLGDLLDAGEAGEVIEEALVGPTGVADDGDDRPLGPFVGKGGQTLGEDPALHAEDLLLGRIRPHHDEHRFIPFHTGPLRANKKAEALPLLPPGTTRLPGSLGSEADHAGYR